MLLGWVLLGGNSWWKVMFWKLLSRSKDFEFGSRKKSSQNLCIWGVHLQTRCGCTLFLDCLEEKSTPNYRQSEMNELPSYAFKKKFYLRKKAWFFFGKGWWFFYLFGSWPKFFFFRGLRGFAGQIPSPVSFQGLQFESVQPKFWWYLAPSCFN